MLGVLVGAAEADQVDASQSDRLSSG
jgi:hypothetical protein